MTVSSSTNKIIGNGNGVTTSWPFSFKAFDAEHLVVTYTDSGGAETTLDASDYTVSLNADQDASPGGTVGYSPAIASGTKLTILRSVPYTQATDIKNQGGFFPEVLERGFDLVVMQVQQLREQLARTLKLSPSQSAIGELEATDATRAGTYLGFDLAGNLSLYAGVAAQSVSAAMQPVVSAASLALARTALGLGSLATSGAKASNADLANMAQNTLKGRVSPGAGAPEDLTAGQVGTILNALIQPGGRLTLTSATPVTTADVTAATAVYYTHHTHDLAPLWDGTHWQNTSFSQLTLSLDSDSGHTGYHQSGKNFDVFLFNDAGTVRIGTAAAWSNDTTRASPYLSRQNGRWVNNTTLTLRHGNGAGDLVNKGAGLALYLGTIRTTANGQTEDSAAKRFVWNTYNRVWRPMRVTEATDAWVYNGVLRQARASSVNQLDVVRGLDEDPVTACVAVNWRCDTVGTSARIGLGVDSTTASVAGALMTHMSTHAANYTSWSMATWVGFPGLGRHILVWLESASGPGTMTFDGDRGEPLTIQSGISGEVWS